MWTGNTGRSSPVQVTRDDAVFKDDNGRIKLHISRKAHVLWLMAHHGYSHRDSGRVSGNWVMAAVARCQVDQPGTQCCVRACVVCMCVRAPTRYRSHGPAYRAMCALFSLRSGLCYWLYISLSSLHNSPSQCSVSVCPPPPLLLFLFISCTSKPTTPLPEYNLFFFNHVRAQISNKSFFF